MADEYWFKKRRPASWQGWLSLVSLLIIVAGGAFLVSKTGTAKRTAGLVIYLLFVLAALDFFIAIFLRKKQPPPKTVKGSDKPHA